MDAGVGSCRDNAGLTVDQTSTRQGARQLVHGPKEADGMRRSLPEIRETASQAAPKTPNRAKMVAQETQATVTPPRQRSRNR